MTQGLYRWCVIPVKNINQQKTDNMKKLLTIIVAGLMALPTAINAQNYSALWKQVKTAQDKDLPKTEYDLLNQIADKAEAEKAYGQLLKARLLAAVSPG